MKSFPCSYSKSNDNHMCGGAVKLLAVPGRKSSDYFGKFEIPKEMILPTCEICNEFYYGMKKYDLQIFKFEDKIYLLRQKKLFKNAIKKLIKKNNCRLNDIRYTLYINNLKFKQYREGTKRAPSSLLALLESYVANNDEFLRQLAKMKT